MRFRSVHCIAEIVFGEPLLCLRDMTDQHQLDKLRSDFIANVSHELRTPISMLQGYSEAIIDGVTANEEERNEMVQIIHDESKRMGRLVTDFSILQEWNQGICGFIKMIYQ